jgi:protein tyrosine/serine phosphatase
MSTPTQQPPLPTPPFHPIPNINNLRDAALFPSSPLLPSLLFRSADVSALTPPDWQALHALGIRHVFDLRSAPEVAKGWSGVTGDSSGPEEAMPDWVSGMRGAGIDRTWTPVFRDDDYSPERLAARYVKYMDADVSGFVDAYHDILSNGGEAYAAIFRFLAGNAGKGVLVHCTAGKDRTGLFFALLFSFLGVSDVVIADEYNLTELGLAGVREEVVGRLMGSPVFKEHVARSGGGEEEGRKAALRMIGARKETMLAVLEMLRKDFGGAETYMREVCGLKDGEMEAVKRNLVKA